MANTVCTATKMAQISILTFLLIFMVNSVAAQHAFGNMDSFAREMVKKADTPTWDEESTELLELQLQDDVLSSLHWLDSEVLQTRRSRGIELGEGGGGCERR